MTSTSSEPSCSNTEPSFSTNTPIASKRKLELSEELCLTGDVSDRGTEYMLVDKGNMLQWICSVARCSCGRKVKIKEGKVDGMVEDRKVDTMLTGE
ncbi:hypothetical protein SK128_024839 [Halocaridina rubra]|uniref:Uncharacterized protein n=1 Tax=Halocaridina rubra TaxID=373956 RepID=A0AAN9A2F9_HALRR